MVTKMRNAINFFLQDITHTRALTFQPPLSHHIYTIRLLKRPKLRLWLSPILPQLRLGKKIFHAKFWASEIAGTFVRVRLKFVLSQHWNQFFYYANFVSAIDFYGDLIVTLTKVPAISEAQNFARNIFLPSLNCGKIGESHSRSQGRSK